MDEKDLRIQTLKAENKKLTEELEQLKSQPAAVDTDMEKLTTEMMEHICDNICKYPCNIKDVEKLEDICAECKMGQFVCDILNAYNRLQQASYDVNKVVEQINELRAYCDNTDCKECKYKDTCFDAEIEKIIKAGGVNG